MTNLRKDELFEEYSTKVGQYECGNRKTLQCTKSPEKSFRKNHSYIRWAEESLMRQMLVTNTIRTSPKGRTRQSWLDRVQGGQYSKDGRSRR